MLFWPGKDWNTTVGRNYLRDNFKVSLSEKSLYNLKKKLKADWENRNEKLDEEVDWNNLVALQELCHIPPQATELRTNLHDIWEIIQWNALTKTPPVPNTLRS